MHLLGRPRVAAVLPVLAVACAAALLLFVALSVALRPPDVPTDGEFARAMAWVRGVCFAGALLAIGLGLTGLGYRRMTGALEGGDRAVTATVAALDRADVDVALIPVSRRPRPNVARVRLTLVTLSAAAGQARGIADFDDPVLLIETMRAWQRQHPDEEARILGPDGAEIARRLPPGPALAVPTRGSVLRRRVLAGVPVSAQLVTGGA